MTHTLTHTRKHTNHFDFFSFCFNLVRFFPAFNDHYELSPLSSTSSSSSSSSSSSATTTEHVYLVKKAQLLAADLYKRFAVNTHTCIIYTYMSHTKSHECLVLCVCIHLSV